MRRGLLLTLLFICALCQLPPNDRCSNAKYVDFQSQLSTIVEGNNIHSQSDNLDIICNTGWVSSGNVWYYFNSENHDSITISTCSNGGKTNFDTVIYLLPFQESCNDMLIANCVAFNDNFPGCLYGSQISHQPIKKNSKYFIVVAGNLASGAYSWGTFELLVKFETFIYNENCEAATELILSPEGTLLEGTIDFESTWWMTPSIVPGCQSGAYIGVSLWYTFNSEDFNYVAISSCYSGGYSQLAMELSLFTVTSCSNQNPVCIAYDSSSCGMGNSGQLLEYVELHTRYYLVMSYNPVIYYDNSYGVFVAAKQEQPENDNCVNASSINSIVGGYLYYATPDILTDITGANVWYKFYSGTNNVAKIDFCSSDAFTIAGNLYIHLGTNCDTIRSAIKNDCTAFPTGISLNISPDVSYLISISSDTTGQTVHFAFNFLFQLFSTILANDECVGATDISSIESIVPITDAYSLELGFDETYGDCADSINSPLIWYTFLSRPKDTFIEVSTCSLATNFDTKLYLFSNCVDLQCLASNDDYCGLQSYLTSTISVNPAYYWIAVGSKPGQTGQFKLSLMQHQYINEVRPNNDECANADHMTIPGLSDFYVSGATLDIVHGFTTCSPQITSPNVWIKFYTYGINTINIGISSSTNPLITELALYYSSSGDDCYQGECTIRSGDNMITTSVIANAYYFLSVAADTEASVQLTISSVITPPVNDDCLQAINVAFTNNPTFLSGTTTLATVDGDCLGLGSNVWYQFNSLDYASLVLSPCTSLGGFIAGGLLQVNVFTDCFDACIISHMFTPGCDVDQLSISLTPHTDYYLSFDSDFDLIYVIYAYLFTSIPPTNDECTTAFEISQFPSGTVTGSLDGATVDAYGKYIWYFVPISVYSRLLVSTCSSSTNTVPAGDTTITLYSLLSSAVCESDLTVVASDRSSCPGLTPYFDTLILPGIVHYIAVGSATEGTVNFDYTFLKTTPTNDDCNSAIQLDSGSSVSGFTVGSSLDYPVSCDVGLPAGNVWYYFNSKNNNFVQLSIAPLQFLGSIFLVEGCACCTNAYVQNCYQATPLVTISTAIEMHKTYYVTVGGITQGPFYLTFELSSSIDPMVNDACENALGLISNTLTTGVIAGTTLDSPEQCSPDLVTGNLWYKFSSVNNNYFFASTCESSIEADMAYSDFSATMTLYQGSGCNFLQCIASNSGCNFASYYDCVGTRLQTSIDPQREYFFSVAGLPSFGYLTFYFSISVETAPVNDFCLDAISLDIYESQIEGTFTGATYSNVDIAFPSLDCPFNRGMSPSADVWYNFQSPASPMGFSIYCFNLSPCYVSFTLYSAGAGGFGCNDLYCVASGDNLDCRQQSALEYHLLLDQTYYLALETYSYFGDFSIRYSFFSELLLPPACDTAQELYGTAGDIFDIFEDTPTPILEGCQIITDPQFYNYYYINTGDNINYMFLSVCNPGSMPHVDDPPVFWVAPRDCVVMQTCLQMSLTQASGCVDGTQAFLEVYPNTLYTITIISPSGGNFHLHYELSTVVPTNNVCNFALAVAGFSVEGTTAGATIDFPLGCGEIYNNVWYVYVTSVFTNAVEIQTSGSGDLVITIFTGSCGALECYTSSDDYSDSLFPIFLFQALPVTTYYISISSFAPNSPVTFQLTAIEVLYPSISNDLCINAHLITLLPDSQLLQVFVQGALDTVISEQCSYSIGITSDVWYAFYSSVYNQFEISLCPVPDFGDTFTNFPVWLELYEGGCNSLVCASKAEEACGTYGKGGFIRTAIIPNKTYLLRVGALYNREGSAAFRYIASINEVTNDECATAISIFGSQALIPGDAYYATQDQLSIGNSCGGVSMDGAEVWYQFYSDTKNYVTISSCPVTYNSIDFPYDSKLFLFQFDASPCSSSFTCIGNDDSTVDDLVCGFPGAKLSSSLSLFSEYYIAVGGYKASRGGFTLDIAAYAIPPSNDDCAAAITIDFSTLNPQLITGSTLYATIDNAFCSILVLENVWYSFINPLASYNTAIFTTCVSQASSDVPIVLLAYDGDCLPTACIEYSGTCSLGTELIFPISPFQTYLVSVSSDNGQFASFTIFAQLFSQPTSTSTPTPTPSMSSTATATSTPTPSMSSTATATATPSTSSTPSSSPTPSTTSTPTSTPTPSTSSTSTSTSTPTPSTTSTATSTPTPSTSSTSTSTASSTPTPSTSSTSTSTSTPSSTPTASTTSTSTPTPSTTPTSIPSTTPTPSTSSTSTSTSTSTPTPSSSSTSTSTPSASPTLSTTPFPSTSAASSATPTPSASSPAFNTPTSPTPSPSTSEYFSAPPFPSLSPTTSASLTQIPSSIVALPSSSASLSYSSSTTTTNTPTPTLPEVTHTPSASESSSRSSSGTMSSLSPIPSPSPSESPLVAAGESRSSTPSFNIALASILPPPPLDFPSPSHSPSNSPPTLSPSRSPSNPVPVVIGKNPNESNQEAATSIVIPEGETTEIILEEPGNTINVQSPDGSSFQVMLPTSGQLYISIIDPPPSSNQQFNSKILQLNMVDSSGKQQTNFPDEVSICFTTTNKRDDKEDQCLGFYNESKDQWDCEDPCLESTNSLLCGKTNHFTNFALLLDGGSGGSGGCDDEDFAKVIGWLSLAFIIAAIAIVIASIFVIELRVKARAIKNKRDMDEIVMVVRTNQ